MKTFFFGFFLSAEVTGYTQKSRTVTEPIEIPHSLIVTNLYTWDHFLALFTQTCLIMRADKKFLAIIPCILGLLPEHV